MGFALLVRAGDNGIVVVMIVAGDYILYVVALHRAEKAVDKVRLGRERRLVGGS